MDYVQDMICLLNDSNLKFHDEEAKILRSFTDEIVGFSTADNINYINNELLKNALHKLIDSGLFRRYFEILMRRTEYSMKNFYGRMDTK